MPSYHERVAAKMKSSYSAGSLNTYDTILTRLHQKFPTEQALRDYVATMETWARASGAPANWTFLDDN